jgi:cobalt-zinc-cadmium efflux system outer membrane protein
MQPRYFAWVIALTLLQAGCFVTGLEIDREIGDLSARVDSISTYRAIDTGLTLNAPPAKAPESAPLPSVAAVAAEPAAIAKAALVQAQPPITLKERLKPPPDLPGSDAPPIALPKDATEAERRKYYEKLYPPIPPLPAERPLAPGPEGRPMTLADLQRLAETYSPTIKNAVAAVEAAKGAAKQAGAYPNPTVFFEQDTVQTFQAGYNGAGVNQLIKTGNKLKLQQAAAIMDLLNAKLALRRAQTDLSYQVRGYYFALLVARENVRVSEALFQFTHEVYRVYVDHLVKGGFASAYEPMVLRPQVLQTQFNLIQARNQYLASWRQLAAGLGLPDMPPSELAGRVDMVVPVFDYNQVRSRLDRHTDVLTAQNAVQKARYLLALAKVTPLPDVTMNVLIQKDLTTPPFNIVHSLQFGMPVPIWDQNKGGIYQANWQLAQAAVGPDQARNALITTLADAYNRYETAMRQVDIAQQQMRDQLRAYSSMLNRRESDATSLGFVDIYTAQQTLVGYISGYITALGLQWQAVVDVANLLQADDLYQAAQEQRVPEPVLDLERLIPTQTLLQCLTSSHKQVTLGAGTGPGKPSDGHAGAPAAGAGDAPGALPPALPVSAPVGGMPPTGPPTSAPQSAAGQAGRSPPAPPE